jgi:hypothetical protein
MPNNNRLPMGALTTLPLNHPLTAPIHPLKQPPLKPPTLNLIPLLKKPINLTVLHPHLPLNQPEVYNIDRYHYIKYGLLKLPDCYVQLMYAESYFY